MCQYDGRKKKLLVIGMSKRIRFKGVKTLYVDCTARKKIKIKHQISIVKI